MWWEAGGLRYRGPADGHWWPVCITFWRAPVKDRNLTWDPAAGIEIRNTEENNMAKAKGSKAPVKHLHKGKKLEAQRPLKGVKGGGKQEFVTFKMNEVFVSNYNI